MATTNVIAAQPAPTDTTRGISTRRARARSTSTRRSDVGDELEIDAASSVDQRVLGITHNPLRMTGYPTKIVFRGRLVADA